MQQDSSDQSRRGGETCVQGIRSNEGPYYNYIPIKSSKSQLSFCNN